MMPHHYIVFLHGAGCDHRMFEPQLPIFDEDYNLLLWDARPKGFEYLHWNAVHCMINTASVIISIMNL